MLDINFLISFPLSSFTICHFSPICAQSIGKRKHLLFEITKLRNENHRRLELMGLSPSCNQEPVAGSYHQKSGSTGSSNSSYGCVVNGSGNNYEDEVDVSHKVNKSGLGRCDVLSQNTCSYLVTRLLIYILNI